MNPANTSGSPADVVSALRNSGLADPGNPVLTLISGGGDSVALLAALVELRGPKGVFTLHVNYGLRGDESDDDEDFCRSLCGRLGVSLAVQHAPEGFAEGGNIQARARELRYALAEQRAAELGGATIAVAHTADDQAETILYRLFASPGRDALHGMAFERGNLVRPFLGLRRAQLREWCRSRGLEWREDSSNEDERFARVRARRLLADAESLHPAAVPNLLRTAEALREESQQLESVVADLHAQALNGDGSLNAARLAELPDRLASRVLRSHIERSYAKSLPGAARALPDVLQLAKAGGSGRVQIEGAAIVVEYGAIHAQAAVDLPRTPSETSLQVPGETRFGDWRLIATNGQSEAADSADSAESADSADSAELGESGAVDGFTASISICDRGAPLSVRGRRPGDRIRPRGMGGTKSLHDLFIDKKLPQRLRDSYPVVCEGERIVWVPGLAVADSSASGGDATAVVSATRLN
ncbi:MAG: tRNA lysidine(34) synthetase TilS [Solirubrobacterales bacterium]